MIKKITLITALLVSIVFSVSSQETKKFPHKPLLEEYTGFLCGWCTRGFLAMELIQEKYGDKQVTISYHEDDDLTVTKVYPVSHIGVPIATIDRGDKIDPYYGTTLDQDLAIYELIDEAIAQEAIAMVEVDAVLEGNDVKASAKALFGEDIDDAKYQIGYILVSDGLTNSRWRQYNEYGYYRDKEWIQDTPLYEVAQWGPIIRGLVYNFVVIDAAGMNGVNGSLPSQVKAGETYEHSFSFNISQNPLVMDPEDLGVVAFIVDKKTGRTVNSDKFCFRSQNIEEPDEETTGITTVNTQQIVDVEYYDFTGKRILNPSNGIFICKEKMADGSIRTIKRIK